MSIEAMKQALEAHCGYAVVLLMLFFALKARFRQVVNLSAQRQWVSLPEQEWERLFELYGDDPDILIRETEAKLRELNGV